MRWRPVVAIASADWLHELRGRRGGTFVLVTLGLLLPAALIPADLPEASERPAYVVGVAGDVPADVEALPSVRRTDPDHADLLFVAGDPLVVRGRWVPRAIRDVLDHGAPALRVERLAFKPPVPRRSLLLALVSSAVLTGAISESIGGERSRKTLQALLSAAVTREEIVTGKWLAWAGYGVLSAAVAVAVAIASGHQEPGWWLLPLPLVPAASVAVGLYLVRRASDVLAGATTSVRWMPIVLAGTGLAAWWVGVTSPLLGAAVPLGGALLAAGDTWAGAGPALVATASTGVSTALLLRWTARDLEESPADRPRAVGKGTVVAACAVAATAWWTAVLGPLLWGPAGNPAFAAQIARGPGPLAGGFAWLLVAAVLAARTPRGVDALRLDRAPPAAWLAGIGVGLALALLDGLGGALALPGDAAPRLVAAVNPAWAGPIAFAVAVTGQELLLRGFVQSRVGLGWATLAAALLLSPFDPLFGLATALPLGLLVAYGRSLGPALLARVVWGLAGG